MTTSSVLRWPVCLAILCAMLAAGCRGPSEKKIVTIRARAIGYEKSAITVGRGIPMEDGKGTLMPFNQCDVTTFEVVSPKHLAGRQFGLYHEQPPEKDSFWRTKGWTFTFTAEESISCTLLMAMPYAAKYMNVKPEPPARCVSVKAEIIETDAEFLDDSGCELWDIPEPPADDKK